MTSSPRKWDKIVAQSLVAF